VAGHGVAENRGRNSRVKLTRDPSNSHVKRGGRRGENVKSKDRMEIEKLAILDDSLCRRKGGRGCLEIEDKIGMTVSQQARKGEVRRT